MSLTIASLISLTICFYANFYMAKNARTPWIRKAATATGALCLVLGIFDMAFLAWKL